MLKKYYHYNPFSIDYNRLFLLFCRDWQWKSNIIDYYPWNFSAGTVVDWLQYFECSVLFFAIQKFGRKSATSVKQSQYDWLFCLSPSNYWILLVGYQVLALRFMQTFETPEKSIETDNISWKLMFLSIIEIPEFNSLFFYDVEATCKFFVWSNVEFLVHEHLFITVFHGVQNVAALHYCGSPWHVSVASCPVELVQNRREKTDCTFAILQIKKLLKSWVQI